MAQVVSAGVLGSGRACARPEEIHLGWLQGLVAGALRDSLFSETLVQLKRGGQGMLATIGSTAPFIGLLGTVVGIINAFHGIAATGSGGMTAVAGGIGEALVSTALGIFVAIPAVCRLQPLHGQATKVSTSR